MTAQDYKDEGYNISSYISQNAIDKAEDLVKVAYIKRILPEYSEDDADVKSAIMALSYMLLCKRNIFATRSGGRVKTNQYSSEAREWDIIGELANLCHLNIKVLSEKEGAVKNAEVDDICNIYFKSNFFYL